MSIRLNNCLDNIRSDSIGVLQTTNFSEYQIFLDSLQANYNQLFSGDPSSIRLVEDIVRTEPIELLNDEGLKTFVIAYGILNILDATAKTRLFASCIDNGKCQLASKLIDLNLFEQDPAGALESLKICFTKDKRDLAFDLFRKNSHLINLNAQNNLGETFLHRAAESGAESLVGWLVLNGANPTIADHQGNTPLHAAAKALYHLYDDEQQYIDIRETFRFYGLREDSLNNSGLSSLQLRGTYFRNSFERFLANINGLSSIPAEWVIYEGLFRDFSLQREVGNILDNQTPELRAALAGDKLNRSQVNDLFEQIQREDFKIVRSGFPGHSIHIVFFKGYMAICDRGRDDRLLTILTHKISLNKLSLSDLQSICDRSISPQFLDELRGRLEAVQDNFCRKLSLIANKCLKTGNCQMNIKGALRVGAVYLALKAKTEEQGRNFHDFMQDAGNEILIDECIVKGKLYSKIASCNMRERFLNEYTDPWRRILRTSLPVDVRLIQLCQTKLAKHKQKIENICQQLIVRD